MIKLLVLLIISIALVFNPATVLCADPDIQDVCDQTPGMQEFGTLLRQYPDIYAIYAQQRNTTIYVPSDQAMRDHRAKTGRIFRRADPSAAQSKLQMRSASQKRRRAVKRAVGDPVRSVVVTADDETSLDRNSVIVEVIPGSGPSKRQFQGNTTQSTGITFYTGSGDTSKIIFGDIPCAQGTLHVVDTVFTLPPPVTDALENTNRTRFLDSINAANLVNDYTTADQVTVFVPTDSAFVNQSTLSTTEIENHTINGTALYSPDLKDGGILQGPQGSNFYVTVVKDEFYINCVRVTQTDVITKNGVIHAVEKILTPLYAPPVCGVGQASSPNSTAVVPYTGIGSVSKAVNLMAAISTIFAMVVLIV